MGKLPSKSSTLALMPNKNSQSEEVVMYDINHLGKLLEDVEV